MFSEQAADKALRFIESLKQSQGQWAGCPLHLMDWQRDRIIKPLFGTLNPDGTRQYRTLFLTIPRKNGKTELAAAIANYLLFADNEGGAQIYCAASDRDQADIVFKEIAAMVRSAPALERRATILDSVHRIVIQKTNSYCRSISAEAYSKHGFNSHGVIFDELHAQPNRDLWDVLTTSTGARLQPLVVAITTAGFDRNSICYEVYDYARKVRDGIITDPTFLPVIYQAEEEDNWEDEAVWARANPALGVFRSVDELRQMFYRAKETPALEMTFRRLYLNQWVNSVQRWLPMDKWDDCAAEIGDLAGKPCYAGLDLSSTTDLTALSLVFPAEDGSYDILWRYWIPEDTATEKERRDRVPYREWARQGYITMTPGNIIDYGYVLKQITQDMAGYDLRELAFDRWGSQKLTTDLQEMGFSVDTKVNGAHLVAFGQGFASMSSPTKELMTLVLSKKIRHGGNPVSRWCADNMVVATDPAGNLKPDKSKATQKIDGMVAMIMALDRAARHTGEDGKSVYETRGIIRLSDLE